MIYDYSFYESSDENYLKQSSVRAGALVTTINLFISSILLMFELKIVVLFLLIIQLSVFLNNSAFNLYTPIVKIIEKFFTNKKYYHVFEVRFQGLVGALFIVLALFSLFVSNYVSLFFVLACLSASQLNAFFGICLACKFIQSF